MSLDRTNTEDKTLKIALYGDTQYKLDFLKGLGVVASGRTVDISFNELTIKDVKVEIIDIPTKHSFGSGYAKGVQAFVSCCRNLDSDDVQSNYENISMKSPGTPIFPYTPGMNAMDVVSNLEERFYPSPKETTKKDDKSLVSPSIKETSKMEDKSQVSPSSEDKKEERNLASSSPKETQSKKEKSLLSQLWNSVEIKAKQAIISINESTKNNNKKGGIN